MFTRILSVFVAVLFTATTLQAQECNVIYVTPGGATSGAAGTKATPASLTYALTLATATDNKIYMAAGTYNISQPLNLVSNVSIEGGFNSSWYKSNGSATTIFRDNTNPQTNPSRLVCLTGTSINNFRLQDLTIRVQSTFDNTVSTYTVYLSGCSNYQIVRCKLIGGNSGSGLNGANGVNGIGGANGAVGQPGDEDGGCCTAGGAGGSGSFGGSFAGGTGGAGGQRGTYVFPTGGQAFNGSAGTAGQGGVNGGGNGNGGLGIFTVIISIDCDRTISADGTPGIDAIDGLPGTVGTTGLYSFTGGYFVPGNGGNGNPGIKGGGGGGGGGGGSQGGLAHDILFGLPPNTNGAGAGGGGGGEGGQGGTGGLGGIGGGAAFCLYVYNNGPNGFVKDCQFTTGAAGYGGQGGSGGIGGIGGFGGIGGGSLNCDIGAGGNGGKGGKGGDGGAGGAGADGVSFAVYEDGSGSPLQQYNINGLQQPIAQVDYSGCTGVPVSFFTPATGTVTWYFGAGATPATATGNTGVCAYNTTGRKTFTMVNNGVAYTFTDFLDIYNNQANPVPTIIASADSICEGQTVNLSSSITANSYNWFITGDTYFDVITGAANQTLPSYAFPTPGNYRFVLETVSACCGPSFADTFFVNVEHIFQPTVSIASSIDTICQNEIVVFTAQVDSAGSNPTYQWLVNNNPVGANAPAYSSSNIANGDVVTCKVTSNLGCGTGLQATSNTVSVYVISPPQLNCTANSFITGEPTFFDSQVTAGGLPPFDFIWDFGDNSNGQGTQANHIYTEPGPYTVTVIVTDANGCSNNCQFVITLSSILAADYNLSATAGCPPLTVDFTNESTNAITYLWDFGDGTSSPLENPSHTYNTPGMYDVRLYAFGSTGNVNVSVANQIAVYPTPTANFLAYPINAPAGGDSIQFSDNSFDATTWLWDFGDPASGSNNTSTLPAPIHWFAANGGYNVTLIVSNTFGCTDTVNKGNLFGVNVGVAEQSQAISGLQIYPNPTGGDLNIRFTLKDKGPILVELFTIDGRRAAGLLNTTNMPAGEYTLNYQLPADLQTGLYLMRLSQNGKQSIAKVSLIR